MTPSNANNNNNNDQNRNKDHHDRQGTSTSNKMTVMDISDVSTDYVAIGQDPPICTRTTSTNKPTCNGYDDDDYATSEQEERIRQRQIQSYTPRNYDNFFLHWFYWLSSIDGMVFVVFLCNIMVLSLPIILVPLAVEAQYLQELQEEMAMMDGDDENNIYKYDDPGDDDDGVLESTWIAAQVASISSVAFLGGAIGKFVNGFICQAVGATTCSKVYMLGMALSTAWFSCATSNLSLGFAFAGMEFFSSIQYAALSVMLSNFYTTSNHQQHKQQQQHSNNNDDEEAQLAAALTALGLASTVGDVLAKVVGVALAACMPWRRVAQIGSIVALIGCVLIAQAPECCHDEEPIIITFGTCNDNHNMDTTTTSSTPQQQRQSSTSPPIRTESYLSNASTTATATTMTILQSLRDILRSTLFWKLAIPYSLVFTAAACDRLLVPFYNEIAGLSPTICGGFTLSMTFGLVHGLVTGSKHYTTLNVLSDKVAFLRNRHIGTVLAGLGLTVVSYYGPRWIPSSTILLTTAVVLCSAAMASSISFQYFQLPCLISQKYPHNKAVCISFLDGMGFLGSIPIFTAMGWIVPNYGWYAGWGFLTVLFALSGTALVRTIPPILDATELYELHHSPGDDPTDLDPCYYFEWAFDIYA